MTNNSGLPLRISIITNKLYVKDANDKKVATHSLVSYRYLEAFQATNLFHRIISQGMSFSLLDDEEEGWAQFRHVFVDDRELPADFVNVVIGFGDIWRRMLTTGVYNVAVTVSWPRPPNPSEVEQLNCYDYVCCPNSTDVAPLKAAGVIEVVHLPIHAGRLTEFFTNTISARPKKNA